MFVPKRLCALKDVPLLEDAWNLVNTNFISSLLEVFIFGIVASLLYSYIQKRNESKVAINKLFDMLHGEMGNNIKICEHVVSLNANQVFHLPEPFEVTGLQIALNGPFLNFLKPETTLRILQMYKNLTHVNQILVQLVQASSGVAAALTGADLLRQHFKKGLSETLPELKTHLLDLQAYLQSEKT